jgi:hypothetical protein
MEQAPSFKIKLAQLFIPLRACAAIAVRINLNAEIKRGVGRNA